LENIELLGSLSKEDVLQLMQEAKALLFPSLWYEGFPMVIVESLSNGLPVITTNIGSQASIINHYQTGYHVEPSNLSLMIHYAELLIDDDTEFKRLSKNARNVFVDKYTDQVNIFLLL